MLWDYWHTLSMTWTVEFPYGRSDSHPCLMSACVSWEVAPLLAIGLLGGLIQVLFLLIDYLGTVRCSFGNFNPSVLQGL